MQILVPEDTYEKLRSISFNTKKSMSKLIIDALDVWDKSKGNPPSISRVPSEAVGLNTPGETSIDKKRGELNGEDYL